jgi:hypothetical protein
LLFNIINPVRSNNQGVIKIRECKKVLRNLELFFSFNNGLTFIKEEALLKSKYMIEKIKWTRIIYIIGVVSLIIGIVDPLEGSVVITAGSALIALSTYLTHDRHWKFFLVSLIMVVIGVFFLFYLSELGGFGGESALSWWWGTLILPYPIGWLLSIVLLIVRNSSFYKFPSSENNRKYQI